MFPLAAACAVFEWEDAAKLPSHFPFSLISRVWSLASVLPLKVARQEVFNVPFGIHLGSLSGLKAEILRAGQRSVCERKGENIKGMFLFQYELSSIDCVCGVMLADTQKFLLNAEI